MQLLQPKEITLTDMDDNPHTYIVGKWPFGSVGHELCVLIGEHLAKRTYIKDSETLLKMFRHIAAVNSDGEQIILKTTALMDNHIPDIKTGFALQDAAIEHNMGFSVAGKLREFQQAWQRNIEQFSTVTSAVSRVVSSLQKSAPTTNSEPSTAQRTLS